MQLLQPTVNETSQREREIIVRLFQAGDEQAFRTLNEAWITKYFRLEDKDRETLEDPDGHILSRGGQIFMALRNGQCIGCCGLIALTGGSMEVAKMAVAESERGQGIGRKLLDSAIDYAREHSVRRLYLETNSLLTNAIRLYESAGFKRLPAERIQPSPYARANVYMEMNLV
jgi:N-acetylglutamate synthase-like GNAT family acetyltransferase